MAECGRASALSAYGRWQSHGWAQHSSECSNANCCVISGAHQLLSLLPPSLGFHIIPNFVSSPDGTDCVALWRFMPTKQNTPNSCLHQAGRCACCSSIPTRTRRRPQLWSTSRRTKRRFAARCDRASLAGLAMYL